MGASLASYLAEVRTALRSALCLHNFPSQVVERHNKPEVEVRTSPELLLSPVSIEKGGQECCLIEQSINSTRVSFKFKAADGVEEYLATSTLRFLMLRADELDVVRRLPVPDYDVSFVVTSAHLERYERETLLDFIMGFVADFYSEQSAAKIELRRRCRGIADDFWRTAAGALNAAAPAAAPSAN